MKSYKNLKAESVSLDKVKDYWKGKNIPQLWYSDIDPGSISFYNNIRKQRFELYYPYLKDSAEFKYHEGEKILEVGVGMGTDLAEYARYGAKVYGIDLGADQIQLTKNMFDRLGFSYEELKVASAEKLPYESNYFDFIYSFGVIHHTPNINEAVNEIYRVLKPGGRAIIMIYARGWKHYLKRCFIHGLLKLKIFKYGFDWQKVYNEVSEVNGGSPLTQVLTKRQVKILFKNFYIESIEKKRLGEFFEYKPYNTSKIPNLFKNIFHLFGLENFLGENFIIKLQKIPSKTKGNIIDVIWKHY
jgi:ubiquinone/menaquinone biosynthesis C-methylase UbiE